MSANCFLCVSLYLERGKNEKTAFEKGSPLSFRRSVRFNRRVQPRFDAKSILTFSKSFEVNIFRSSRILRSGQACVIHGLKILYRLRRSSTRFSEIFQLSPLLSHTERVGKLKGSLFLPLLLPSTSGDTVRNGLRRGNGR